MMFIGKFDLDLFSDDISQSKTKLVRLLTQNLSQYS